MGNPDAQTERSEVSVACSMFAGIAYKLEKEQKNGDGTITGDYGKTTISEEQKNISGAVINSNVRKHRCFYNEETGLSVRIIDGKTVKANPKLMKETLETRRKQGRTIKTRKGLVIDDMNNINEKEEGPEI